MNTQRDLQSSDYFYPEPTHSKRRGVYMLGLHAYTEDEAIAKHVLTAVHAYIAAGRPDSDTPHMSVSVEHHRLHDLWKVNLTEWNAALDGDLWATSSTAAYLMERAVRWEEECHRLETGEFRGLGNPVVVENLEILRKHLDRLDREDAR